MIFGFFAGFLGTDPEERFTAKGKRVIVLRVAVKTRQGMKDETIWCKCNIWHDRYDKMLPYLKKGSAVIIGGDITVESYMSREGSPQSSLSVSVDSLKFSPFGKTDRAEHSDLSQSSSSSMSGESSEDILEERQDMAFSSVLGEDGYVTDDIPF